METMTVQLGAKGQLVIPEAVCELLGLKEGDTLMLIVDGPRIILRARPANFTEAMLGLHKEVWEGVDVDKWLDEERSSCDRGQEALTEEIITSFMSDE